MNQRLQKILSERGVCSRRQAENWILSGRISCNGTVCTLGQSADPDVDRILVDGKPLPALPKPLYIMLHKPKSYVTTMSDEKGRANAAQLVRDCGQRVYPVGRLDMDSEGLLLFTNDGEFAKKMMHPSFCVDKTYIVDVKGCCQHALQRMNRPMTLDGCRLAIPSVEILELRPEGLSKLKITIHEGRNRQVRRMCAIAGMQVKRLVRVQQGELELGDLPVGKWRHLTEEECQLQFQQLQIVR